MKKEQLLARANPLCELCTDTNNLEVYQVLPEAYNNEVILCSKCIAQIEKKEELDATHWQKCLNTSIWSEVTAIQVLSWRILNRLKQASWAADLLDMIYLEDAQLAWAKALGDHEDDGEVLLHKDSNGAILQNGDSVVLTKSLDVRGSTINAKMGTVVKNIRLVEDNTEQIEGKIEGQVIVILTKYLRKQNA